jgi:hypothetical protein
MPTSNADGPNLAPVLESFLRGVDLVQAIYIIPARNEEQLENDD